MANNVDLMVVGAADGVTADELTQRLVSEFNQPAEAFSELVAAACSGGSQYAAQSGVSLDTAVEGQGKLEELGVVCELLVDGEMLPSSGFSSKLAEPDAEAELTPATELAPASEQEIAVEATEKAQTPVIDAQSSVDEPSAELSIEEVAVDDAAEEDSESALPSKNGLEVIEVDFNDELNSLDELKKVKVVEEVEPVNSVVEAKAQETPVSTEPAAGAEKNDEPQEPTTGKSLPTPDEPLELTLALDDSEPLTKPKKKGDAKPDDGGLTLLLDDEPLIEAVKQAPAMDVNSPVPPAEGTLEVPPLESPESRDTTREPVEISPPVEVPEEEAEPQAKPGPSIVEPPAAQGAEIRQIGQLAASSSAQGSGGADNTETTDQTVAQSAQQTPEKTDDITSFIESLAADTDEGAGGLVLPGQVATGGVDNSADVVSAVAVSDAANGQDVTVELEAAESKSLDNETETPVVTGAVDLAGTDEYAPEVLKAEDSNGNSKRKLLGLAAAAIGVVGVGGLVAMQSGLLDKSVEPEATVFVTPVKDDNAELDAVEEVSLNAAIERAAVLKNPDKFSTEELIAYLAKDLGENAKNELKNYVSGDAEYKTTSDVPRMGAAIPAHSDSELWLRNRVDHPADKYFDEWSKREVDLQAYLELQDRLIEVGDLEIALDVSKNTKDKLFAVMSQQRIARAFHKLGSDQKAAEVLARAVRATYAIEQESERVLALADYALTEQSLGFLEDAEDSFLKASILSRSLHKPQNRTVSFSSIAEYFHKAERDDDALRFLELAMTTAYELPVNTAARDLAIRHVALTEVRLGLVDQATGHASLIVDPFAAVSTFHGIALELERTGDEENARLTLNKAYRAGSLIRNSDKREKLLEKIRLSGK